MIKKLTIKRLREIIREKEWSPTKIIISIEKDDKYIYLRPRWMFRGMIIDELKAAGIEYEEISDKGLVFRIKPIIDVDVDEMY